MNKDVQGAPITRQGRGVTRATKKPWKTSGLPRCDALRVNHERLSKKQTPGHGIVHLGSSPRAARFTRTFELLSS